MFREVDAFADELRAHYRRKAVPKGDDFVDAYLELLAGMSRVSASQPRLKDHFDNLLAVHREQIPFEQKRAKISSALASASALLGKPN